MLARFGFSPVLFNALNCCPQPILHRFFEFMLVALPFHGVNRFPGRIQRNVMARNAFILRRRRDQIGQKTFAAGMWTLWIVEVDARE
jgi:hypothetical protein